MHARTVHWVLGCQVLRVRPLEYRSWIPTSTGPGRDRAREISAGQLASRVSDRNGASGWVVSLGQPPEALTAGNLVERVLTLPHRTALLRSTGHNASEMPSSRLPLYAADHHAAAVGQGQNLESACWRRCRPATRRKPADRCRRSRCHPLRRRRRSASCRARHRRE